MSEDFLLLAAVLALLALAGWAATRKRPMTPGQAIQDYEHWRARRDNLRNRLTDPFDAASRPGWDRDYVQKGIEAAEIELRRLRSYR